MQVVSRTLKVFITLLVVLLPFSSLVNHPVKAESPEPVWTRITDTAFSEENNQIYSLTSLYGTLFWNTRNNVYLADGSEYISIGDDLTPDFTTVQQVKFMVPAIYATTRGDTDQLWGSVEPNEWIDFSAAFDEIEDFEGISYMENYGDEHLVFQVKTSNEETAGMAFYTFNHDEGLVAISDEETFAEELGNPYFTDVEAIIPGPGDDTILVLFSDYTEDQMHLYTYDGGVWSLLSTIAYPTSIESLVYQGGFLGAYINMNGTDPGFYEYDGEGGWTELSDGDFEAAEYTAVLEAWGPGIIIGTSRYDGGLARLVVYTGSEFVEVSDHVGDLSEEEGENNSYITGIEPLGLNMLIVAAGLPGEGPTYASLWSYGISEDEEEEDVDTDEDGILDEVEDEAPNEGDANDDDVADSEQANVTSFENPITDTYTVLETSCEAINSVEMVAETDLTADSAFSYPVGLTNFELACEEGETATVIQYFYGTYDASLMTARKYREGTYINIPDAEITNVTIDSLPVLRVSYEITDGGDLDDDGDENGIIVDPAGPALNSAGVPNTGFGAKLLHD